MKISIKIVPLLPLFSFHEDPKHFWGKSNSVWHCIKVLYLPQAHDVYGCPLKVSFITSEWTHSNVIPTATSITGIRDDLPIVVRITVSLIKCVPVWNLLNWQSNIFLHSGLCGDKAWGLDYFKFTTWWELSNGTMHKTSELILNLVNLNVNFMNYLLYSLGLTSGMTKIHQGLLLGGVSGQVTETASCSVSYSFGYHLLIDVQV